MIFYYYLFLHSWAWPWYWLSLFPLFVEDLAAAPFVVLNCGHNAIVESLTLGKAVLAEPIFGQYEQQMNAPGLEALGVGRFTQRLCTRDILEFAEQAPTMRDSARKLRVADNDRAISMLETAISDVSRQR